MNNFEELGLSQPLLDRLNELGFLNPTPIQAQAIPLLLSSEPRDFIGLAQTGTGKTAAFGLPLSDLLDDTKKITQAIIMAPTRELIQQTANQLLSFNKNNKKLRIETVYGGASIVNQIRALNTPPQIIAATPGRLLDLIDRGVIELENVRYVVLDEADEMLNMGFKEDIDKILSFTPKHRVTWLFSATMPKEIKKLVNTYMNNPAEISVNLDQKTNIDITHKYVACKASEKITIIRKMLDTDLDMRGIMFCRTKRETDEIAVQLSEMGYNVEGLHGDMSQAQRDAAMRRFKQKQMQLLIATDVAARGIDVNNLSHVINHTLPDQLESYTHRSGRTGRAGQKGLSIALVSKKDESKIRELERKFDIKFERFEVPKTTEITGARLSNWAAKIGAIDINTEAVKYVDTVIDQLNIDGLEDLVAKLISAEMGQFKDYETKGDNNQEFGSRNRDDDGERRRLRGAGPGFERYFINIGSVDGFAKKDLIQFLADYSNLKDNNFQNFSVQPRCTYFDVSAKVLHDFENHFRGLEIEGRKIRVNPEDDGEPGKKYGKSNSRGEKRQSEKHKESGKERDRKKSRGNRRRS